MCGIVGMAGNLNSQHSKMFRDMLAMDFVRGVDSTGIAMVPCGANHDITVEKAIGHPGNLWDWGTSGLLNDRGVAKTIKRCMIGHNRAATIGVVNEENAHPFTFGDITGVHNGSLTDWYNLEGYRDLDVDSKAIFNTISLKGIDHTWKNFVGAAALVYWDSKEGTLSIIRNGQRPLMIAESEKGDAIFWASEAWMLTVAASRNNVKLKTGAGSEKPLLWQPKENWLHVYKPTGMTCPLQESRELEKKTIPTPTTTMGGHMHGGVWYRNQGNQNKSRLITPRNSSFRPSAINKNWAKGYAKGDKALVGTKFRIISMVEPFGSGPSTYYIKGETSDGELVHIYPSTTTEKALWDERCLATMDGDLWFKMTARPRLAYMMAARVTTFHAYRIGSASIEALESKEIPKPFLTEIQQMFLPSPIEETTDNIEDFSEWFKTFSGSASRRRWWEMMKATSTGGDCIACSDPISIEDHREINWLSAKAVLCPICAQQQDTIELLQQMGQV